MRRPFEPVQWSFDQNNILSVRSPWIDLDIDIDEENKAWVQEAVHNLSRNPEIKSCQQLLSDLKEYRLSYLAPRPLERPDSPTPLPKSLPLGWSLDPILTAARCPNNQDLFDPVTLVSYLEAYRLKGEAESDQQRQNLPLSLERLKDQDEERFFYVIALLYRQTYEITRAIQRLLPDAILRFPVISEPLTHFLEEEKGHDTLMRLSLRHLGYEDPETLPLFNSIKKTLELLDEISKASPLAMTLAVGFFEGSFYQNTDDLAECIKHSSNPKAAIGYQRHFEINREGHHTEMIFELAAALPAQLKEEVEYATACLEALTLYGQEADTEALQHIKLS